MSLTHTTPPKSTSSHLSILTIIVFTILFASVYQIERTNAQTPSPSPNSQCSITEEPIIGDWGFYNIANNLSSPWVLDIDDNLEGLLYFCTDDECGTTRYSLQGFYYAYFTYDQETIQNGLTQTYTLEQNFQILNYQKQDSFYIEFFVSSSYFPSFVSATFSLHIDYSVITLSSGSMIYGDYQRVDISNSINSQNTNHTLQFMAKFDLNKDNAVEAEQFLKRNRGKIGSSNNDPYGFQLASVVIRREPYQAFDQIQSDLYVSVTNGSDVWGNGTASNPFATIDMAIQWINPNYTIYLYPGVYCKLAMFMEISKNLQLKSITNNPNDVVLNGENRLNIFKIVSDELVSTTLLKRRNQKQQQQLITSTTLLDQFSSTINNYNNSNRNNNNNNNVLKYSIFESTTSSAGKMNIVRDSDSLLDTVVVSGITILNGYSSSASPGGGAVFIEGRVMVTFENCIFLNNVDYSDRGVISLRSGANLVLSDSIISNNSISKTTTYGPTLSMLGFSIFPNLLIENCTFLNNQHCLMVDQSNKVYIKDSTFIGNNEATPQLCFLMISRVYNLVINNTSITDNKNCALCLVQTTGNISNSLFDHNNLYNGPGGNIYISQNSIITLQSITIQRSEASSGAALFIMEGSNVFLQDSIFSNITSQGAIVSLSESSINILRTTITFCEASYMFYQFYGSLTLDSSQMLNLYGGIWSTQATINVINTYFYNNQNGLFQIDINKFQQSDQLIWVNSTFEMYNGMTNLIQTVMGISNITVTNSNGTLFFIRSLSELTIDNSRFSSNQNGLIQQQTDTTLLIRGSIFDSNTANQGSVLLQYDDSTATISNCTFSNNFATDSGGCIYSSLNSNITILNSLFENNVASMGGVISAESNVVVNIEGGTYQYNKAIKGGGGIVYYIDSVPIISNTTILNNNQGSYGNVTATPPAMIILDPKTPFPNIIVSDITMFSGRVSIYDNNNQIVVSNDEFHSLKIYLQIQGTTVELASVLDGNAIFTNVTLTGEIGTSVSVSFLSNEPTLKSYELPFQPWITDCLPGYVPTASGTQCSICSPGSYGYDGKVCLECPDQAFCSGGSQVLAKTGYWYDESQYPRQLYQCPNKNCLGNNTCAPNTYGVLCSSCATGYYDWGNGCVKCQNSPSAYFILIIPLLSFLMILWVQRSDSESGLMTVIIYFVQTLIVLSNGVQFYLINLINLQLDNGGVNNGKGSGGSILGNICPGPYDFYARHYLSILSAPYLLGLLVLSTIIIIFIKKLSNKNSLNHIKLYHNEVDDKESKNDRDQESLDDINNNNNNNNNEKTQSNDDNSIDESMKSSLEPTILVASSPTKSTNNPMDKLLDDQSQLVISYKSTFLSRQFGAFIKLCLNIYSPIATSAFIMFFCQSIGNYPAVLVSNAAVTCSGDQYRKALIVSYSLFVVIVGMPIVIFILLFRHRREFTQPYVIRMYGVFFLKYKSQYYYWDVILLVRRLFIVLLSMMPSASTSRSFLLVVTTLSSVLLQLKYKPFKRNQDNQLEFTSLSLLFVSCVYLDNSIWQTIEQWVIIISGVVFTMHLLIILYRHSRHDIIDHILHAVYFISRGRLGRKMVKRETTIENNDGNDMEFTSKSDKIGSLLEKKSLLSFGLSENYGSIIYDEDLEMDSDSDNNDGYYDSLLYK